LASGAPLAAALLIAILALFVFSGHAPEFRGLVPFSANGLVTSSPSDVTRIEIRSAQGRLTLHRGSGAWLIDATSEAAPGELVAHIESGLRFMHVSGASREITESELTPASFAEFGLDPPATVVVLDGAEGTLATASFGLLNPAGTSQYVRLAGAPTVFLMPRHVGIEWQIVSDIAHRLPGRASSAGTDRGAGLLLPVSIAQVWAIEIVAAGKLTRFERDGAGDWFRHVGQHSHAGSADTHLADPAQARIIREAFEAFDASAIERHITKKAEESELTKFGLALPPLIVLFYARDSSTPLTRLEFGVPADSFNRYARLGQDGDVVTVAEFEVRRLTELLKAVGAGL